MTMGRGGVYGDPDMLLGRAGQMPGALKRKRGLLGEEYMPEIDEGTQASIDQYASMPEQKGLLGFWQGGDKFTARDGIAGLLAAVGDAFSREGGGEGGAVNNLVGGRAKAFAEAKKQAQQEQLMQAGMKAGRSRDEMALVLGGAANYGDFKPQTPYRTTDNVGNVWEQGPDGQFKRVFTDTTPKMYIQGDKAIEIANPFVGQGAPLDKPVGKLTPITNGGSGNAPTQPAGTITASEYQNLVRAMGPKQAANHIRMNNIAVIGN